MEISQLNGNTLVDATFYEYVHTVGAVIFSFNDSFSPSALWGGSWSRVTDRFLIGSGGTYSSGVAGGETSVTLTTDQMPNHEHGVIDGDTRTTVGFSFGAGVPGVEIQSWSNVDNVGKVIITETKGGNQPHNNMPPYIGCNIWRKIA